MATLVHRSLIDCQAFQQSEAVTASSTPLFARFVRTLRLWRRRIHERRQLAQLTQRDFRDMGVSSSDVWNEINQPFWRSTLRR